MADSSSPKELFISYGREPDVNAFVSKLRRDLEQNGFTVWLDLEDIHSGSDWHNAIGGGLYNCSAILPVITNKYLSSSYCVKELYTADGDRKHIFPIMFEDVDFDLSETARGVKFTISSINWTMCRPQDDYNNSISRLILHLREKGLGQADFHGPNRDVKLGVSAPAISAGPRDTSEPVLVVPDVEMVGGIASGENGLFAFSDFGKHQVKIMRDEDIVATFGTMGIMEDTHITSPAGLTVSKDGHLLVASLYHLKKISWDGGFLETIGDFKQPDADETLFGASGMTVGKEGRVYIVETAKNRVKIFNSDLTFHSHFSKGDKRLGPGRLNTPMDIASDSHGRLYVADLSNNVIQVFSPEGAFLFKFGKQGHTLGCIQSPMAVAVDPQDYVYVASGTGIISIFHINDNEATFIKAFGSHGAELGQFGGIRSLHIDRTGKVYVGETINKRIQIFQ